jgi:peptidoglycan L-alanyl-D-glutamate endopeptidase CwlK
MLFARWKMINSRAISDLNSATRLRATAFKTACAKAGIDVLITSTYRDMESQRALYAQGRTASGNIVTNAKPGQSWHNWRCAFDFVPIVNGKAQWNDTALFEHCGKIAESVGLEWAGRWKTFKEMAHCQYTGGYTLADYQSGKVHIV